MINSCDISINSNPQPPRSDRDIECTRLIKIVLFLMAVRMVSKGPVYQHFHWVFLAGKLNKPKEKSEISGNRSGQKKKRN